MEQISLSPVGAGIITPSIRVLDLEQMQLIHRTALDILGKIGVRVRHERARALLQKVIGRRWIEGDLVRLPGELVDDSVKMAPDCVDVYDRRGNLVMQVPDVARFGPGVTCLYYQEPESDALVPFGRKEIRKAVCLGQVLDSFDFVTTPGILRQETGAGVEDALAALELLANTNKPVVLLVSKADSLAPVLDLFEFLHGDLRKKPFVIPLVTPITPLVIDAGTTERMFVAIQRGLPMIYVNYGMAGVSTPITPYGTVVLLIAEVLAGVTLSQLIRRGTPVIAGCLAAYLDMRTMVNFYDPVSYLLNLVFAEMMAFYQIPHYGNSGNAVGWGADLIAAGHQWFNHITTTLGTKGMAAFVGSVLGSKAFSPTLVVYADEIISQARRVALGFEAEDTSALLEEISQAGPGGNFLANDRTLRQFRTATFNSRIFPRLTLEEWQQEGCPRATDCLRRRTIELLETAAPPDDYAYLIEAGEAFIDTHWKR